VNSALLKSAIKIHNVIGAGIKLPDDQLEEESDEGGLTYFFHGLKMKLGIAGEIHNGRLISPHMYHVPRSPLFNDQAMY
jgi:hypothetical protein